MSIYPSVFLCFYDFLFNNRANSPIFMNTSYFKLRKICLKMGENMVGVRIELQT
jgi:hypothetical protein